MQYTAALLSSHILSKLCYMPWLRHLRAWKRQTREGVWKLESRSVGVAWNADVQTLHKGDSQVDVVNANDSGHACA